MKKWTKVLSAGALAVVAGVSLTACSGSAAPAPAKNTKVDKFTIWADPQDIKFVDAMKAKVKETIGVDPTVVEVGMLDQEKKLAAVSKEEAPDLITLPVDTVSGAASKQLITPVDKSVNDQLEDSAKSMLTFGNDVYGTAKESEALVMYYNKDKLKEAPKTFEDFLSKKNVLTSEFSNAYFGFLYSAGYGAKVYDDEVNPTKFTYNSEESVKGVEFAKKLQVARGALKDNDSVKDFVAGRADALIGGPWSYAKDLKPVLGDKLGIAIIPEMESGKSAKPFAGMKTWQMTAQAKANKHQDATEAVMKVFASKDAAQARMDATSGYLPVKGFEGTSELVKVVKEQVLKHSTPAPRAVAAGGFWKPAENAIKQVLEQNADPKTALDAAVAESNKQITK
ncbi:MAG: sugar ABC transporter substrate-binding protein [Culicoidibacterales bacterium]